MLSVVHRSNKIQKSKIGDLSLLFTFRSLSSDNLYVATNADYNSQRLSTNSRNVYLFLLCKCLNIFVFANFFVSLQRNSG